MFIELHIGFSDVNSCLALPIRALTSTSAASYTSITLPLREPISFVFLLSTYFGLAITLASSAYPFGLFAVGL